MRSERKTSPVARYLLFILLVLVLVAGYQAYRWYANQGRRAPLVLAWLRNPRANPEWMITAGERCRGAPFVMPTDGFVGFLWGDSFRPGHNHQGLDIFGGGELNQTPVIAAYPGYLSRSPDWKSALIIRVPDDPLQPGRQIWTYYTHMADAQGNSYISSQFPSGTSEVYVEAGTLLGYQGNFSGDPYNPVGIHLHFSIVKDDGQGKFLNELEIENTLDPSPYLGLPVNASRNNGEIPICPQDVSSS
jgi:murein DD-endopeptidase MepM/ murein hydrolase activator NlpD